MTVGYIDVEMVGDDRGVAAMLRRVSLSLESTQLAFFLGATVGTYLKQRAKNRFEGEGDDASGKWAPLQPSTVLIRERGEWPVGGEHPINKRTSELEQYITGSDIMAGSIAAGAMVMYPGKAPSSKGLKQKLETAQKGRTSPRTVPRPVLAMNQTDMLFVLTELSFYVSGVKK